MKNNLEQKWSILTVTESCLKIFFLQSLSARFASAFMLHYCLSMIKKNIELLFNTAKWEIINLAMIRGAGVGD